MAVDEKYVEVVGEEKETENYDDILEEFGAEASFKEDDSGITLPTDYYQRELKTLPVDELFEGKPHLGNVETIKWNDKKLVKNTLIIKLSYSLLMMMKQKLISFQLT